LSRPRNGQNERNSYATIGSATFFQPLQSHLEPPDLLVELGLEDFLVSLLTSRGRTEYAGPVLEELASSLADLGRMDLVLAGQFTRRFAALGSLKRYFELEFGATPLPYGINPTIGWGTYGSSRYATSSGVSWTDSDSTALSR
jgi:hypothetical protein